MAPEPKGNTEAKARPAWLRTSERGSVLGIRILIWLCTFAGRWLPRLVLRVIAGYYVLFSSKARRASRAYLERVHGEPARLGAVYRHILCFAEVTLDRIFFLKGRIDLFDVRLNGAEHVQRLTEEGQGAVLLTAHLGSPAAMAAKPEAMSQNITVVAHHGNARKLNDALSRLDKGQRLRFLSVDPTSLDSVLAIRERVEQGELLIVAADRLGLGEGSVEAPFLGQPAPFPLAPFSLCSVLRVPVYLVVALYRRPNIYELYCEPFAETLFAKRSERKAVMEGHVRRYAERLEHYCRLAPDNWFNLYDFWQPHDHD